MRLSTRARYALRMTLDITKNGEAGKPVSLADVADRTDISRGYLEQLALTLRNARLLRSVSGRYGGYFLARSPAKITLREIIEATIGRISVVACVEDPETCSRAENCECRVVYSMINIRIGDVLDSFTVADMLQPDWSTDAIETIPSEAQRSAQRRPLNRSAGVREATRATAARAPKAQATVESRTAPRARSRPKSKKLAGL